MRQRHARSKPVFARRRQVRASAGRRHRVVWRGASFSSSATGWGWALLRLRGSSRVNVMETRARKRNSHGTAFQPSLWQGWVLFFYLFIPLFLSLRLPFIAVVVLPSVFLFFRSLLEEPTSFRLFPLCLSCSQSRTKNAERRENVSLWRVASSITEARVRENVPDSRFAYYVTHWLDFPAFCIILQFVQLTEKWITSPPMLFLTEKDISWCTCYLATYITTQLMYFIFVEIFNLPTKRFSRKIFPR